MPRPEFNIPDDVWYQITRAIHEKSKYDLVMKYGSDEEINRAKRYMAISSIRNGAVTTYDRETGEVLDASQS